MVWQKSMTLTEDIYTITKKFPSSEIYGITSQMRRCSLSIPSNIAEGGERNSDKLHTNFLHIAKGSAAELETQIILSQRLGFISHSEEQKLLQQIQEILKMLSGFISTLKKSNLKAAS
ncbi:MAG: four helix bundle protein [candidate division SR1 bacterium]|nr:four helix bundle protein [candidate division SR1 bacterium]